MDQHWGRSLDVVGLYSNIPIQETINAAVDMLEVREKEIGMLGLEVEDVIPRLVQCVEAPVYFRPLVPGSVGYSS